MGPFKDQGLDTEALKELAAHIRDQLAKDEHIKDLPGYTPLFRAQCEVLLLQMESGQPMTETEEMQILMFMGAMYMLQVSVELMEGQNGE